ncbi:PspC domain-containing protein [Nakamurella sp. A5-74]|uniref:PspC domain-containing protein n=1 Tax=Nakamurella sp. A5-74 TaxID=3158264 RepID=A0AAU8DTQ3_9ACTN
MSATPPAPEPADRQFVDPPGRQGWDLDPSAPQRIPAIPRPAGRRDTSHTPDGIERLFRSRSGVLGGVAGGLSTHLRIPALWVRIAFAVLGLLGGAGVVFYALLWIFVPLSPNAEGVTRGSARDRRQAIGVAAIGVALVIVGGALGIASTLGWILGPMGVVAIGAAFIWKEADDSRRARWRRSAAGIVTPRSGTWWRLAGGVVLVVGGLTFFALGQFEFSAIRSALIAVLLTLVGVGVITVPWWLRLIRALGDERSERAAEAERAEIAAHLHDSVLQTLALIQRQAADPREVARLARGQERELRTWLYGPAGYAAGAAAAGMAGDAEDGVEQLLSSAITTAAGDVEDTYAIKVAPVIVGEAVLTPALTALVAAAREAMVNAAKHSGEQEISVFAEVEDGTATVFVRDRGRGFDPQEIGDDRHGLAESIRGRMERNGGTATIRSSPGAGAEVELRVSIEAPRVDLRKSGSER